MELGNSKPLTCSIRLAIFAICWFRKTRDFIFVLLFFPSNSQRGCCRGSFPETRSINVSKWKRFVLRWRNFCKYWGNIFFVQNIDKRLEELRENKYISRKRKVNWRKLYALHEMRYEIAFLLSGMILLYCIRKFVERKEKLKLISTSFQL